MQANKNHKAFEAWAMPRLKEIQKVLLLEHFDPLRIEYNEKSPKESCSELHYPYQSITIRYSDYVLEDFKAKKYYEVISVLAHEMAHVLTDPMYSKGCYRFATRSELEDDREKLTDHIANIVMKNSLLRKYEKEER